MPKPSLMDVRMGELALGAYGPGPGAYNPNKIVSDSNKIHYIGHNNGGNSPRLSDYQYNSYKGLDLGNGFACLESAEPLPGGKPYREGNVGDAAERCESLPVEHMAYHASCYKTATGTEPKYARARYASKCQHCAKDIQPGDAFTWTRRTSGDPAKVDIASSEERDSDMPQSDAIGAFKVNYAALADNLVPHLQGKVAGVGQAPTVTVEVKFLDTSTSEDMGIQHKQFPTLLKALSTRRPVWLAGPSGSGKTYAAAAAAKALGMTFRYTGAVGNQYGLMGYMNATGAYVRTQFREAYEHGGVFLWDEVDASDPNALLAFNAALSNGHAAFPDGMVSMHQNCVLIAAANTYGHGGTHEYVGRLKLDSAFLKRFSFITWDYDWSMTEATCSNAAWVRRVKEVSERVLTKGIRVLVTPRECYIGADLLQAGIDQDTVENMTIRSGMTAEQWKQVQ